METKRKIRDVDPSRLKKTFVGLSFTKFKKSGIPETELTS